MEYRHRYMPGREKFRCVGPHSAMTIRGVRGGMRVVNS